MSRVARITSLAFLLLAAGLAAGVIDVPDHDFEWFLAYLAVLSALGMLAPALLFRLVPRLRALPDQRLLGRFEIFVFLAMAASWIGSFGLYRDGFGYDTFVHFFASAIFAVMVIVLLSAADPRLAARPALLFAIAAGIALAGGIVNEVFEWGGDRLIGTAMYGEAGESDDTLKDFAANAVGILAGAAVALRLNGRFTRSS